MKKIFFVFFLLLASIVCFSQKIKKPIAIDAKGDTFFDYVDVKTKAQNDSCYAITKKDTIWKTSCPSIQQQPSFPNGEKALFTYLGKNTTYPNQARDIKLQGKVFITFVIDKKGDVTDVEIYKGLIAPTSVNGKNLRKKLKKKYLVAAKQINDESLRVVRAMTRWSPGMQDGKPVKVRYILPLFFKLQ